MEVSGRVDGGPEKVLGAENSPCEEGPLHFPGVGSLSWSADPLPRGHCGSHHTPVASQPSLSLQL